MTPADRRPRARSLGDMDVDVIVLAGGRGSRLGGIDKSALEFEGESMLDRTLRAVAGLRAVVVGSNLVPDGVVSVFEEPRLGGPAAAIGAGLAEVSASYVLVVACDQPFLGDAVVTLLMALGEGDGVIAVDETGRRQHLMIAVRTEALASSAARHASLDGMSVRALLEPLDLVEIAVPARSTQDLDTWHDIEKAEVIARHREEP